MVFRKPEPTDKMDDHAEQHSHAFDEISNLKDSVDNHSHNEYISSVEDTDIRPNKDNPFVSLKTRRFQEEDGTPTNQAFGLEIDLDEGNTYKNQFSVGNRNGYALKVVGGTGLNTWFGGKVTQKGDSLENNDARDYIIRKNLNEAVDPLVEKVDHNEDRINALEAELEAVAETKSAGEWKLVSTIAQAGDMSLSDNGLTIANNVLTLHQTDLNGVTHGFSGVEVGDLVEVVEEHEVMSRSTGDYGLYRVTGVNGQTFTLELQQGRGIADLNKRFYVKFFYLSEEIDIAELDARYSTKGHTHSYASTSHTHNYASSSHSHNYASSSHTHSYASSTHTHAVKFSSGTNTNPSLSRGEPYLNTSLKVVYVGL